MGRAENESAQHAAPCAETAPEVAGVDSAVTPTVENAGLPSAVQQPQPPHAGPSTTGSSAREAVPPADPTFVSPSPLLVSPHAAKPSPLAASLIGQLLDHYELLEFVGGGGMGLVFRALDTSLNRTVALKILSVERAVDDETVRRFRNEAQSAARLDHDNIARVHYVGQARGLNYIVFEYIEGTNLRDLVAQRGPLPLELVLGYSLQIAAALTHASDRGVVHRDIKPSNVLVTTQGRAKLVDMGLSRLQIPDSDEDLTASGVTLGTFDYISPEQARDPRNADVRSDIYSLGCTMYFMLTGRPPFPDGNAMQKLLQHQGDAPPELAALNLQVPEELARIVKKTLAKDPQRRHQDPRALIADLSLLASELGLELPRVNVALVMPKATLFGQLARRHVPWLVPLAVMLLTIVVLDWIWAARNDRSSNIAQPAQSPTTAVATKPEPPKKENPPRKKDASPPPKQPANLEKLPRREAVGSASPLVAEIAAENPKSVILRRVTASSATTSGTGANGPSGGLKVAEPSTALFAQPSDAAAGQLRAREAVATRLGPSDIPITPTAVPAPPLTAANVLYVDPAAEGNQPQVFPTLKAALENVKSGGTIELRYSGRQEELPVKLANLANPVTVKPSEGYEPVVVFQPYATDATAYARHMIALSSAQLNLRNVAIELYAPPPVTSGDSWALFSLHRSQLDLKRCTLTIANASPDGRAVHEQAAFFQVHQESGATAMMMPDMQSADMPTVTVRLSDCVARGEAAFVHAGHSPYPLDISCTNGVLALSQPFFKSEGARMGSRGGKFSIELDHVTANLRGGLCRFVSSPGSRILETRVRCTNSILLGPATSPLIQHEGDDTVGNLQNKLMWTGDKNLYDGFQMFWRVMDLNQSRFPANQDMMLTGWQKHWGPRETPVERNPTQPLGWQSLPEESRLLHKHVPDDYRLRPESPAVGNADQGDVGARLQDLPPPPPRAIAAPKPARNE